MNTSSSKSGPTATGRIRLEGLEAYGHHGDLPAERELGGHFWVDVDVATDTRRAARSDKLEDTVNYVTVEALVRKSVEGRRYKLLETLAERLAEAVLKEAGVVQATGRGAKRAPLP